MIIAVGRNFRPFSFQKITTKKILSENLFISWAGHGELSAVSRYISTSQIERMSGSVREDGRKLRPFTENFGRGIRS